MLMMCARFEVVRMLVKNCRLSHSPPVAEISSSKFSLCYLLRVMMFLGKSV
ncbi:hypothetical protein HanPSC8_Chr03g0098231 [Helianthus annuus]|nr:hypothetical protein HanPSC8_Chr03g0098231 [Helianthus annuus]